MTPRKHPAKRLEVATFVRVRSSCRPVCTVSKKLPSSWERHPHVRSPWGFLESISEEMNHFWCDVIPSAPFLSLFQCLFFFRVYHSVASYSSILVFSHCSLFPPLVSPCSIITLRFSLQSFLLANSHFICHHFILLYLSVPMISLPPPHCSSNSFHTLSNFFSYSI